MKAIEVIHARGHENIIATNKTTFEITGETHLTKRGDCIIAVGSDKGARDLNFRFKKAAQNEGARIKIVVEVNGEVEVINAWGSPQLSFVDPMDLVVRKSDYVCGRTLAVRADKAAKDFSKTLVEKLQGPRHVVKVTLIVESAI